MKRPWISLLALVVLASPAYAARIDVMDRSIAAGCELAAAQEVPDGCTVAGNDTFVWTPGDFAMLVDSEVRYSAPHRIYTYFYRLYEPTEGSVEFFSMNGHWDGSQFLNWGEVDGELMGAVHFGDEEITFTDLLFNTDLADVNGGMLGGLDPNETVVAHTFRHHNAFLIVSNGHRARYGSITSKWEHFAEWKRRTRSEGQPGGGRAPERMLAQTVCWISSRTSFCLTTVKPGATRKIDRPESPGAGRQRMPWRRCDGRRT